MKVIEDADLSEILWYKLGGKAKYLLEISSRSDIEDAISFLQQHDLLSDKKFFIVGYGSNLIFAREYFDGAVLRFVKNTEEKGFSLDVNDSSQVNVFAGESLDSLIQFGFAHNLIGLQWAGGLPGTVGAAIRGNVGAYGGEIKDTVISADVVDCSEANPNVRKLTNDELAFVYRGSFIKTHKQMIVYSATFHLQVANSEELAQAKKVYEEKIQHRKDKHPLEYPNCGSVFKNIRDKEQIERVLQVYPDLREDIAKKWYGKVSAAILIERLGLKGFRIGNAQVSEKHALFIVNLGCAIATDVIKIIDTIQQKFQETFGFQLEPEVEIVK